MPDIVCLGEPLVEFNQQADGRYLAGQGGDACNCAVAAARQGASVGMLTRLGADAFGDGFMDLWAGEGIDASRVARDAHAHTGLYFVTHGTDGHRFSYLRAGSAASRFGPEDVPADYLAGARVLHVSGISQAISERGADAVFGAIEIARAHGVRVSYDTNLRTRLWPLARARAVIQAAVRQCQIVLPGYDDAVALTGLTDADAIVDAYLTPGVECVALTLGADGTLVATPDERQRIAARKVVPVDATGAGDTFDGAFLAELVAGRDPFAAARYANAAAALSTQQYGAVPAIPRREAVEALLDD